MLKDITTIELRGANFRENKRLSLFSRDKTPVKTALVYGRNGSGKSTIAKAFRAIKGDVVSSIQSVTPLDSNDTQVTLTEEERDRIFIFDEDFVHEKIRIQEEGLESIVMFGEQVGLSESIETANKDLREAKEKRDRKKQEADKYNNAANDESPKYYIEKMKAALKGDNNWAGRCRKIKGNAINTSVTDETYKTFIGLSPTKTRDELIVDFNNEYKNLEMAQKGMAKISADVPSIPPNLYIFNADTGNNLLKKIIEHPELNEREQYLLSLVQGGKSAELHNTVQEFEDPKLDHCPKCHQPLSAQYKIDLIASIRRVLSEDVKNHQQQLEQLKIPKLEMDLSPFQKLAHYQECVNAIEGLNGIIETNNKLFDTKKEEPYTPVNENLASLDEGVKSLRTALEQLENDRDAYNQSVTDTNQIKNNLCRINNEIAYFDVNELYLKYKQQESAKQTADKDYRSAQEDFDKKQKKLNELNAKLESVNIAVDIINEGLKCIFYTENRILIHADNGVYKLLCNNQAVRPKDVSVGERNILGLCYFFVSILQKKKKYNAYKEEYLVIIDDPVSSYDLENKIGVLSYLKYQLSRLLLGNIETRVMLLTHDLMTVFNIENMFEGLKKKYPSGSKANLCFSYAPFELLECSIKKFENNRNEYKELLNLIYKYGVGGADEQKAYIGNIMRQVLEAFTTFEYGKGIESISADDKILATMKSEQDREHFKNLMYRIVLNEGSHRYNQTRSMHLNFFSFISESETRRTAKEILCLMYLLNAPHLRAHLGDKCCDDIEKWCEERR